MEGLGRVTGLRAAAILLLVLMVPQPAAAAVSLKLGLLAVKEEKNGLQGVVIDTVVELAPGSGRVVVQPAGMVDESTLYSTRLGFMLSTALAGKSYRHYDLHVRFETNTPVGGPSASGFLASTILLLSMGYSPDTNTTTMTGMVSPAGLVLSVAGVPEKARAAVERGYRVIVLPRNEAAALPQGLPARTVAACSIMDAAEALANVSMPQAASLPRVPVPDVFRRDAQRFINYTERLLPLLDNKTRHAVAGLVREARQALRDNAYTAASLAFTALLRAANYTASKYGFGRVEKELGVTLGGALREARQALREAGYRAGQGLCYTWRFAALSAAAYRLYLAEHVSSEAGPFWKTLALLRALSARTWARAAEEIRGPLAPCSYLAATVNTTLSYAETSLRYFTSILNMPLIRVLTHLADNRTMSEWLRDARAAYSSGNYPLALGLTVYVLSEIEYRMDAPNTAVSCLAGYFPRLYAVAGDAFAVPALYYHSYAEHFIANTTGGRGDVISGFRLESAALAWMLPAVFLHSIAAGPGGEAAEAYRLAAPLYSPMLPYALLAGEAFLLAVAGVAAARASRAGKEV